MDRDLQASLLLDNPWLEDPGRLGPWLASRLPRRLVPRLVDPGGARWEEARRAHLVVGPRQAGKSTLLWAHLASVGEPVLFVDCEQPLVQSWCRSAPLFLRDVEALAGRPVALLLDEVQHLDEAGLFIKGLVDRRFGAPIFVTGSSSYHLGARTRESLAGRATRTRLLPFSLAEVTQDAAGLAPALRLHRVRERCLRHAVVGGYPDAWLADDPAPLLRELVEALVLRDASDLFRIARPDALRTLLRLLAGQVGSLVNLSEWASVLGVSRDTVAAYLGVLEQCHVVAQIRPFVGGKRSELTSRPKVYLVDPGVRSHLVGDLRPPGERADAGAVWESWVFSELLKSRPPDRPVRFWRSTSGAEVDFVFEGPEGITAVEVKAQALTRPRLPRAARSFVEAYHPRALLLVNTALNHTETLGKTRVRWTTPWRLPEHIDASEPEPATLA